MLDQIKHWDEQLLLLINGHHNLVIDQMMWYFSEIWVWVPFYLLLTFFIFRKYKSKSWYILGAIIITIALSDQITSSLLKPLFERPRPSHDLRFEQILHILNNYRGGRFGFASSHASNTFALALMVSLVFRNRNFSVFIFCWASVVSFSRIYLGVHYPGDVLTGALIGLCCAWFAFYLLQRLDFHFKWQIGIKYSPN